MFQKINNPVKLSKTMINASRENINSHGIFFII